MRTTTVHFRLNGRDVAFEIDQRLLLVELVRDVAGLKGTRIGCATGDCGACTLRVEGKVVKSCLMLAASVNDKEITTIEGADDLVELQSAFVEENGFQCGFCTTGMVLTAAELLSANPDPTDTDIRTALIGNLCRCTGYDPIVNSVRKAAAAKRLFKGGVEQQRPPETEVRNK